MEQTINLLERKIHRICCDRLIMRGFIFLSLSALLAIAPGAFCQTLELKFDHITSENGLSQNTINAIAKDKYGFMWFGTESGICRFDGYRFKVYRYVSNDNRSINSNKILNIFVDIKNRLWVETYHRDSLCRYNFETDDFERIAKVDLEPALLKQIAQRGQVSKYNIVHNDYQWHINPRTNALVQTYKPTGQVRSYSANPSSRWSLSESYVSRLYLDDQKILWAGTYGKGINKADLEAKPFRYFYHDPTNPKSIIDNNIGAVAEDVNGSVWVGTRYKGITIIHQDFKVEHLVAGKGKSDLMSNKIRTILTDSKGYVWIGTKIGLDRFDPHKKTIFHFTHPLLKEIAVYGAVEDPIGNIWFATWAGIFKFDYAKNKLVHFDRPELSELRLKAVAFDSDNNLWVGSEGGGVTVWKIHDDKIRYVRNIVNSPNQKIRISDNRVTCIFKANNGDMWIGTSWGLNVYDAKKKSMTQIPFNANGLSDHTIAAITQDNKNYIWVSHKRGISKINFKNSLVRNYSLADGLQSNEFSDGAVLKSKYQEKMYFGGNNGLNSFRPDSILMDKSTPPIVLTELQVLNKVVEINQPVNGEILLEKPLYLTKKIELSHLEKTFAIEFAALHYSNVHANKYAYKLEGFYKEWVYTDASRRVASYSNLPPGDYVFLVKASNGDGIWNPHPTSLRILVYPPLWASNWAYAVYLIVFIVVMFAVFRYIISYTRLKSKMRFDNLIYRKDRELNENKIQFFTNISHEIKTPLSLILAPIEQLLKLSSGNDQAINELTTMKSNGDRLSRLINQLLDLRRLETGNASLKLTQINLVVLIHGVVNSFDQLLRGKNISVQFKMADHLNWYCDAEKIENVLFNLVSNAIKFTQKDGQIIIAIQIVDQQGLVQLLIEVLDDGIGINDDEIESIFLPFKQASITAAGGTGLGLTYSKSLVELHNGTILAESRRGQSGNQTVFKISLPELKRADCSIPQKPILLPPVFPLNQNETLIGENLPLENRKDSCKLLIVEDNVDMRQYLKTFFSKDYLVAEAGTGREGLIIARSLQPDLIVSDVMMPEMDGFEFTKNIKADFDTSHIPVVLLTAKSLMESQLEGIDSGADDYLVKPFNLELLSSKLKGLLRLRAQLREKYKNGIAIRPNRFNPISHDEKLLKRLLEFVEEKIAETELTGDEICEKVGVSRTQLYRKVKALTGMSITELVREIRLKRAQDLLSDKRFNVNEVSFMVGFSTANHFRKAFKLRFNQSPTDYMRSSNGN